MVESTESEDYVSLKKLAELLGMDKSNARRYVLKLGVKPHKRRTPDSGNQLCLAVTTRQSQAILEKRKEAGFLSSAKVTDSEQGVFYVVQLVPEFNPNRVKLGFTMDINERMGQHRTAAPTAKCVKTWGCRRPWEVAAIAALTSRGCSLVSNEVYECDDLQVLVDRGDAFFSLLPSPDQDIPLAPSSPLRE